MSTPDAKLVVSSVRLASRSVLFRHIDAGETPVVDTLAVRLHADSAILINMKIRLKLSGAPLAYTLALVEGTTDNYKAFGTELWSDNRVVPAALKELVFLRTSIVNQCPT